MDNQYGCGKTDCQGLYWHLFPMNKGEMIEHLRTRHLLSSSGGPMPWESQIAMGMCGIVSSVVETRAKTIAASSSIKPCGLI
jgi:hypothetical protein